MVTADDKPELDEPDEPAASKIDEILPTRAAAGSDEKIDVLEYRFGEGLPLYHPDDSRRLVSHEAASQEAVSDEEGEVDDEDG